VSGWRALTPSLSRWDVFALIGGVIGAAIWYWWSTMDAKDTVTPKYILLLPAIIVLFRKPIDILLTPLHAVKKHVPRLVLIAAGLAVPYLVTHYFYKHGVSNFPLAQKSIVWGTILSYVVLRIPDTSLLARVSIPRASSAIVMLCMLWLGGSPAFADDFARDKRRLEDGLRTPGWAETIAGTAATVISVLVNGALVFQRSSGNQQPVSSGGGTIPGRASSTEEPMQEPTHYTLDVRTENERTSLVADDQDRLWVYAKLTCLKGLVKTDLTKLVSMTIGGEYAGWVSVRQAAFSEGYKAVLLGAKPPRAEAELKDEASVILLFSAATADGETIEGPITVQLRGELNLDLEVLA
jgi:hypothetical protein